jgi:Nucleotide-binding protein implicated in inhibition of septum formation
MDQLKQLSGQTIEFLTCTAMRWPNAQTQTHIDRVNVTIRTLTDAEIARYVAHDQPIDTVGSLSESLALAVNASRAQITR